MEKENISLTKKLTIDKSTVNETLYSPMPKTYSNYPFKISIKELLKYMISKSDNNACDILINYVGGTKEVEKYIKASGFNNIKILVTEKEMNNDIEKQYLNEARPIDIIKVMKFVRDGNLLTETSRKFLDEIMVECKTGENKLKAGIQKNIYLYSQLNQVLF